MLRPLRALCQGRKAYNLIVQTLDPQEKPENLQLLTIKCAQQLQHRSNVPSSIVMR